SAGSRADLLALPSAGDGDLARFRLFGDGDAHGQHARVVARLHPVDVERVPEEQLPGERPTWTFPDLDVVAVAVVRFALGLDGEHVALDVQVDRVGRDTRQVELDDVLVPGTVGVHRHRGGTRRRSVLSEELLGHAV